MVSMVLLLTVPPFFGMQLELESYFWEAFFGITFGLAWLFLFIVSPVFISSLRSIALAGWIIAFGVIISGILMRALVE